VGICLVLGAALCVLTGVWIVINQTPPALATVADYEEKNWADSGLPSSIRTDQRSDPGQPSGAKSAGDRSAPADAGKQPGAYRNLVADGRLTDSAQPAAGRSPPGATVDILLPFKGEGQRAQEPVQRVTNKKKVPRSETQRTTLPSSLARISPFEQVNYKGVVDQFIRADIGQLQGAANRKAFADFYALGPRAIPSLVDGLNRAVNLPASCPAIVLASKLGQIIQKLDDTEVLDYIHANVGKNVIAQYHGYSLQNVKNACNSRRVALGLAPYPGQATPSAAISPYSAGPYALAIGVYAKNFILNVHGQLTATDPFDRVRTSHHCKVHYLKMEPGSVYIIHSTTTIHDGWLRLEDSQGRELASNDDFGDTRNSRIVFAPTAADNYRIIVTTFSSGATGPYSLTVAALPSPQIN
jgi:hypothetical protein